MIDFMFILPFCEHIQFQEGCICDGNLCTLKLLIFLRLYFTYFPWKLNNIVKPISNNIERLLKNRKSSHLFN